MFTTYLTKISLILFLLCCSAFFSSSETAFFSLNTWRMSTIQQKHEHLVQRLRKLFSDPLGLLITILLMNTLVNVLMVSLTESIVEDFFHTYHVLISVIIVTPLLVLFGEITPKMLAVKMSEIISPYYALVISLFKTIVWPVRKVLEPLVRVISYILKVDLIESTSRISEEEFRSLLVLGQEAGEWGETERERLDRFLRFKKTNLTSIMTPRAKMKCVNIANGVREVLRAIKETQHSRIPIYENSVDNIIGVVWDKDFLGLKPEEIEKIDLASFLQKPFFVPFSKNARYLLKEMQENHITIAFILDEHGGCDGMVTMEDLLEGIVGEIYDDFDEVENYFLEGDRYNARISARMPLKDFNRLFDEQLKAEDITSIGGYIFEILGRLPHVNEEIIVGSYVVTAIEVRGSRIMELQVEKKLQ